MGRRYIKPSGVQAPPVHLVAVFLVHVRRLFYVYERLNPACSRVGLKTVGINPVPFRPDFYILPARFLIFGQIRNQYEIRDIKFETGTETV